MDEHRITKVRVNRGILEEEDVGARSFVQEPDGGPATEGRNFPADRSEPVGASENPLPDATDKEIAFDPKERF
jgi:hypothetical protein